MDADTRRSLTSIRLCVLQMSRWKGVLKLNSFDSSSHILSIAIVLLTLAPQTIALPPSHPETTLPGFPLIWCNAETKAPSRLQRRKETMPCSGIQNIRDQPSSGDRCVVLQTPIFRGFPFQLPRREMELKSIGSFLKHKK